MTPAAHEVAQRQSVAIRLDGNLSVALHHASHGRPVFPCRPDRSRPLVKWGAAATTDAGQIQDWWHRWPDALPGVATGATSDLAVIDLDTKNGEDGISAFARLVARHGPIPPTLRVRTPSGGLHLLFRHPGRRVKTCASLIAPGVDVRGDGGFIFAPGAALPDGRAYRVLRGPDDPATMPNWLIDLVAPTAPARPATLPELVISSVSDWARAVLIGEAGTIATAGNGKQQETLNARAFRVGLHVAAGRIPRDIAENALIAAGERMADFDARRPWRTAEITRVVRRALDQAERAVR